MKSYSLEYPQDLEDIQDLGAPSQTEQNQVL